MDAASVQSRAGASPACYIGPRAHSRNPTFIASPRRIERRASRGAEHPRAVALIFLRLGAVAFGGPAAHVALMRHEFVERRRWLSEQRFLDLLGVTNLIPGPNSTEMAIHLGFERAGRLGLLLAGAGLIVPAVAIVVTLAWAYVEFSAVPVVGWLLYGVKPVVIAVVLHAMWGLGRRAMRTWRAALIGAAIFGLSLLGVSELVLLAGGLLLRPSLIAG